MTALHALTDGAVAFEAATRARVRLTGADARAFLHRLSTNHVSETAGGQAKLNVLTTDKGRIVDLVHHVDRADEGVLLVGSAGRGQALVAWLDRYLFTEKVEVVDLSSTGTCLELAGRGAPALVDALVPGAANAPAWGFVEKDGVIVLRTFARVDAAGEQVPCFLVLAPEQRLPAVVRASAADGEAARIAAGVPALVGAASGELIDRHNPLDLGLHDAIHWNKGCYIGQEVIARLDTYQKQHKVLATLRVAEVDRARLAPGASLVVDGAVVGEVTSVSPFSWGDRPNALAVAKVAGRDRAQVRIGDVVVDVQVSVPAAAQAPHG